MNIVSILHFFVNIFFRNNKYFTSNLNYKINSPHSNYFIPLSKNTNFGLHNCKFSRIIRLTNIMNTKILLPDKPLCLYSNENGTFITLANGFIYHYINNAMQLIYKNESPIGTICHLKKFMIFGDWNGKICVLNIETKPTSVVVSKSLQNHIIKSIITNEEKIYIAISNFLTIYELTPSNKLIFNTSINLNNKILSFTKFLNTIVMGMSVPQLLIFDGKKILEIKCEHVGGILSLDIKNKENDDVYYSLSRENEFNSNMYTELKETGMMTELHQKIHSLLISSSTDNTIRSNNQCIPTKEWCRKIHYPYYTDENRLYDSKNSNLILECDDIIADFVKVNNIFIIGCLSRNVYIYGYQVDEKLEDEIEMLNKLC